MTFVGCDLHARTQQVAVLDTRTGELVEQELAHDGDAVERFDRALPPPVTIGTETTGYPQWFHALMHQLGHTVVVGEAAKIRAMVVRKTKTHDLQRRYFSVMQRRGRPKAKVALARKLLVRLYIMLRDQIDYEKFRRRGRAPRPQQLPVTVM